MANTKTLKTTAGPRDVIVYLTLAYVDSATETDYVIYDSSAVATTVGDTDPLTCTIVDLYASVSAAATARVTLSWDATTDVVAMDIPAQNSPVKVNFNKIGGLPNQGGSGKTGDILLDASGLSTGDVITLVMKVRRN